MIARKLKRPKAINGDFEEMVARLIQTDPAELVDGLAKVKAQQEEIRRNVEAANEIIARGARQSKHRFSL